MQILGPTANQRQNTATDLALFKEFLNDPKTAIPLTSNFIIGFDDIPDAIQKFGDQEINNLEPRDWKIEAAKKSLVSVVQSPTTDGSSNYCLFAQGVTLPSESLKANRYGPDNDQTGGLLSGLGVTIREAQSSLETVFLETNLSFIDFLIRPWVIAVSHYGLRERKNNSIKTNITVMFFDKYNNNQIRKAYKFYQCVPINFTGPTASYGDNTVILPKVSWAYNYYSVVSHF